LSPAAADAVLVATRGATLVPLPLVEPLAAPDVLLDALVLVLLSALGVLLDVLVLALLSALGMLLDALARVLLSATAVPVDVDPDVPPQAASATVRLPTNIDQASRPPPKLRLASFMRPLE
jgi:hypothetical protein